MRIGLGLAALGRPGYLNLGHGADLGADRSVDALRRHTHAVLDAAYEGGVQAFDAARSYGRAEEFLGEWLDSRRPEGVTVSSKWGYVYTANWHIDADEPEVKRHDAGTLRRQFAETRERLGDWLALYQIHSATPDSGVLEDEEVLTELAELRAGGLAVGVSVSGTSQRETIDQALRLDLFDAVQATWNLRERAAEEALVRAHATGLRVYVKETLANGRLGGRAPAPELEAAAADAGATPDALALAAVLARPSADVVLSGAATVETLRSDLRAIEVGWSEELGRRLASMEEDSRTYWARRRSSPGTDWHHSGCSWRRWSGGRPGQVSRKNDRRGQRRTCPLRVRAHPRRGPSAPGIELAGTRAGLAASRGPCLRSDGHPCPRAQRQLDSSARRLTGVEVESKLVEDQPVAGLLNLAADRGAQVIVTGTAARVGLDRILVGSVMAELAALAPCPVIAVPEGAALEEPGPV